jgi:hypothetical protein
MSRISRRSIIGKAGAVLAMGSLSQASGKEHKVGDVAPDATGTWQPPVTPTFVDWIVVLAKKSFGNQGRR